MQLIGCGISVIGLITKYEMPPDHKKSGPVRSRAYTDPSKL